MTATERDLADRPAADPEVRMTAYMFGRAYAAAPEVAWRAPGGLALLGGGRTALAAALPWGTIVAAGRSPRDAIELYSMNHHTEAFTFRPDGAAGQVPAWAAPCIDALDSYEAAAGAGARAVDGARAAAGARAGDAARAGDGAGRGGPPPLRLVVNCEMPAELGLLTGAETSCAVSQALADLYGRPAPESVPSGAYAAARHARAGGAVLLHGDRVEHLPFDLAAAGLRLLIIDVAADAAAGAATGADDARAAAAAPRPAGGEDALAAAAALRSAGPAALGELLTAAHRPGIEAIDAALETACAAGALGGRAIGRCAVALAPVPAVPRIRSAVLARLAARTRRPPRFLTATTVAGAHRVT